MSLHLATGVGSSFFHSGLTLGALAVGVSTLNVYWQKQFSHGRLLQRLVYRLTQVEGPQLAADLAELHSLVKSMQQEKSALQTQTQASQVAFETSQASLAQAQQTIEQLQQENLALQTQLIEQKALLQAAQTSHAQALGEVQAQLAQAQAQLQPVPLPALLGKVARVSWQGVKGAYRWYTGAPSNPANEQIAGDVVVAK